MRRVSIVDSPQQYPNNVPVSSIDAAVQGRMQQLRTEQFTTAKYEPDGSIPSTAPFQADSHSPWFAVAHHQLPDPLSKVDMAYINSHQHRRRHFVLVLVISKDSPGYRYHDSLEFAVIVRIVNSIRSSKDVDSVLVSPQ